MEPKNNLTLFANYVNKKVQFIVSIKLDNLLKNALSLVMDWQGEQAPNRRCSVVAQEFGRALSSAFSCPACETVALRWQTGFVVRVSSTKGWHRYLTTAGQMTLFLTQALSDR